MPFTDNFNGEGSDVDLASHTPSGGTAWTRVDGAANAGLVGSSGILRSSSATNTLYTCDDQGSVNQYVQFEYRVSSNDFVCNRATNNQNFIGIRGSASKVQIFKRVANTFTQIGTDGGTTLVAGDIIRLESSGDVHTAYVNGNVESGPGGTDAAHNTVTTQGVCIRSVSGNWVDNFEAGTLAAGASRIMFRGS